MADEQPDLEHGIYRVHHSLGVGKGVLVAESDLIFDENDQPVLVLEWGRKPDGEQYPDVTLKLDPALLTEAPGPPGYFDYSGVLHDPRPRH
ncbi:MAG: hypothetical protein Q8M19_10830 [Reyranella sp.]|nr:hypothetical protein [Reyranella sp.]